MSSYWRTYPHKVLCAYAQENSANVPITDSKFAFETIAAGRYIPQDREYIDEKIKSRNFFRNQKLKSAVEYAKKNNTSLHLVGLISSTEYYSKIEHLLGVLEFCHRNNFSHVYLDLILDNQSASEMLKLVSKIRRKIFETGCGQFSSVCGKNFAFTDVNASSNIIETSLMFSEGKANFSDSIEKAINNSLDKHIAPCDLKPTLIRNNDGIVYFKEKDSIIFFNFNPANIRTLVRTFVDQNFKLSRYIPKIIPNLMVSTFTKYFKNLNTQVIFERETLSSVLPEIFAKFQKTNLRISEQKNEQHITTFFNGGREEPFLGETRIIVETERKIRPQMNGAKITLQALAAIKSQNYDFILIDYPNVDALAHTGNIRVTGQAVLAVDKFLGQLVDSLTSTGGALIVTADHGIAEEMNKPTHSFNPVPFVLIAKNIKRDLIQGALAIPSSTLAKIIGAKESLADIAPTILELMGLPKPEAMTGHSLLNKLE